VVHVVCLGLTLLTGPAPAAPTPDAARALAEDAYIYAYPMLETYRVLYARSVDRAGPGYLGPFNTWTFRRQFNGPESKTVVRPNNDTLYAHAWLDVRAEPIVLYVPPVREGRYYSVQLIDLYTHNFGYMGTRTTGSAGGHFLVAGPHWKGGPPKGIQAVFRSESQFVAVLARVAVHGPHDLAKARAVQDQFGKLQPLSGFLGKPAPPPAAALDFPRYDREKAASSGFICYVNFLLSQLEDHPSERARIKELSAIGIGRGRPFHQSDLDPATHKAVEAGVAAAKKQIAGAGARLLAKKHGWVLVTGLFGDRARMQGKELRRAFAAMVLLYGNDEEEAYYPFTNEDAAGEPLDAARHRYVLRFARDQLPPVRAFWSLTMYRLPEQLMVDNPIWRYSIGDRTRGLRYGADGSLTLYLQRDSPGKDRESNWLPAPNGRFSLQCRLYLPRPEAFRPSAYAPPPVERR
jgi:hypothetical protein